MTREEAIRNINVLNAVCGQKPFYDNKFEEALDMSIKALEQEPKTDGDCISRQAVKGKLNALVNEMETIFADIRESKVDDSVCGLCEYDCDHGIDGFANECPGFERDDCFKLKDEYKKEWESIDELPSVTPQEPKTGRWLWDRGARTCSICGQMRYIGKPSVKDNYCPNCGAKMESEV